MPVLCNSMDCVVHQAPLSMGFPSYEYWSGMLFPSPGYLPDPGIKPTSPALAGKFFTAEPPKPQVKIVSVLFKTGGAQVKELWSRFGRQSEWWRLFHFLHFFLLHLQFYMIVLHFWTHTFPVPVSSSCLHCDSLTFCRLLSVVMLPLLQVGKLIYQTWEEAPGRYEVTSNCYLPTPESTWHTVPCAFKTQSSQQHCEVGTIAFPVWSRRRWVSRRPSEWNCQDSGPGLGVVWFLRPPPRASLVTQLVKNPPTMWETWVWSLGWEDTLEKGKATHSSILAWRIPWTV